MPVPHLPEHAAGAARETSLEPENAAPPVHARGQSLGRRAVLKGLALGAGGALAPALLARTVKAATSGLVVETVQGKVRGSSVAGARVYKGIRYGASTAGANRFMPPAPVMPWAGIRDATQFGNSAPQQPESLGAIETWYTTLQPLGEDCLFLNVFAPAHEKSRARRPVMVWLHGGGWSSCAGTSPGFDGTNLARDGEVVVVTVNHRLNVFGYLYLGDKDPRFADAGSAGMLDLVAALRWVRDNIGEFGGDPHNVTIFGQSGGAAKVTALMGMPAARGLFHKAVVESCSGGLRLNGQDEAVQQGRLLAEHLGMPSLDGAALQAVPMERLIAAMHPIKDPFRPVLDRRNFLHDPFDPAASELAASVPMLVGNAATETTLYLAIDPRNLSLDAAQVHQRVARLLKIDAAEAAGMIEVYRAELDKPSPSDVLAAISTDYIFRRNTLRVAELQARQAPVYAYLFDWHTPVMGGLLHAPHTVEVPFVFGTTKVAAGLLGHGPEIPKLSRDVMGAWTAFARTGNPNTPHLPHWPQYDATGRASMLLNVESRVAHDPGGQARKLLDKLPPYEYNVDRSSMLHA